MSLNMPQTPDAHNAFQYSYLLKILAPYYIPNRNITHRFVISISFDISLSFSLNAERFFSLSLSLFPFSAQKKVEPEIMAQKRDKEETENLPICCTPPQAIPPAPRQLLAARLPECSDPKISGACDPRTSSAASPDLVSNRGGALKRPREVTRCSGSGCRKRIGLMGFRCKCGDMFCSEHRYSDRHDCSYDYKAAGREAIARENPVIRAAKLLKV